MNKVSYASLKLKTNTDVNTFDFDGNQIEVLRYLPIEDKYDLIMITLQESKENDIYNPIKLEMNFNLNLIYMYSNLSFTEKQKENPALLYDRLKSNGFIDMFINNIQEDEYQFLFTMLGDLMKTELEYSTTAAGVVKKIVTELPQSMEAAAKIVDSFDPKKFQAVIDFAEAANGGRSISTNLPKDV